MKWLHAADLHLDSPLRGLDRYEGAPVERFRKATRRALEHLVDLCLDEEVDLVLLAGDLFDGDWKDYATGLFFAKQMSRLREGEVQVVWIRGNHDAASRLTKHLGLPKNVRELATRRPETIELPELGVAVHGQGFPKRAVTEDLAARYPEPVPGAWNIGLLHTALGGRQGHAPYAPTSVEVLRQRGYDYWALGHVHAREVVAADPWIVFPGNLQGRHLRETGPKGATVIEVEQDRIASVDHRVLDAVRWERVEVDLGDAASADDAVDLARDALEVAQEAADDRPLAVRLVLTGATRAHRPLQRDRERTEETLRALATDLPGEELWLADMAFETDALGASVSPGAGAATLGAVPAALERLDRSLAELARDPAGLEELARELEEVRKKLPPDLRQVDAGHALAAADPHADATPEDGPIRGGEEHPPAEAVPPGLAAAVDRVRRWLPARLAAIDEGADR